MTCFSIEMIKQLLIWAVIFIAVFSIISLLLPLVLRGLTGVIGEAVNIVIGIIRIAFWAAVAIVVIIFAFDIIGCLIGHAPSLLPSHR